MYRAFVFLGPPHAGKTTAAALIQRMRPELTVISTGPLLEAAMENPAHPHAQTINSLLDKQLIPDEVVFDVLAERTATLDPYAHVIFDGFPRTTGQSRYLLQAASIDAVFDFSNVSVDELERRRENRIAERIAANKKPRKHDTPEAAQTLREEFMVRTRPAIAYLSHHDVPVFPIDASQIVTRVAEELNHYIGELSVPIAYRSIWPTAGGSTHRFQ